MCIRRQSALFVVLMMTAASTARAAPHQPVPQKSAPASAPAAPAESIEELVQNADSQLDRLAALDADDRDAIEQTWAEVENALQSLEARAPDHARLAYLKARAMAYTGRNGDAVTQIRRFLDSREGRNEWKAHRLLGDLFVDEFPQLSRSAYGKALELNPGEPSVLFGLSRCAHKLGQMDEAVTLARRAVEAQPDARYFAHLARLFAARRQWPEARQAALLAVDHARQTLRDHPGRRAPAAELDVQLRNLVDVLQLRMRDVVPNADDYLELAGALAERAANANLLANFDRVSILAQAVRHLHPDAPVALREQYATALVEVGRRRDAADEFAAILESDPSSAVAVYWLERLKNNAADSSAP